MYIFGVRNRYVKKMLCIKYLLIHKNLFTFLRALKYHIFDKYWQSIFNLDYEVIKEAEARP